MSESKRAGRGRRRGGREARRAGGSEVSVSAPYIKRKIPLFEVLDEEGLQLIENNADTILEEVGIEFRDMPEALDILKQGGAEIDGVTARFPRGLCRSIIQASAQKEYTQHARNLERSVQIGGMNTVFVPAYGSPFVYDIENGRRYATIEDFQNFVKLAYMSPSLHHSGGTICEPADIPVNKRHLDMVYSHIKYSDKAFM